MKQYLNDEQTAKLIELGFEKPTMKNIPTPEGEVNEEWYSIGELIEMLPKHIEIKSEWCRLDIYPTKNKWYVNYENIVFVSHVKTSEIELIDALYYIVIKLKEEEII